MKKLMSVVLVVFLLLAPLLMQRVRIEWVNASPSTSIFADATDGYLDSSSIVYSTFPQMSLGDWSNDAYSHCYVKFSLSGVSGALSSATLSLYVYISYHDGNSYAASPLTNPGLGDCQVIHIADYDAIDTSDFSAASIGNDPGVLLSGSATPNVGYVSIDVRAAMQDDMNHGRAWSTFMLRMSTATDGNSDNDYWVFYTSRDASPAHHPYVAYDLVPVYQGSLILTGNNVTTIAGRFYINGSIIVEDNATLVLNDATVNFTQTGHYQFNITLKNPANGNPRLQSSNSTITSSSSYWFMVSLYQNSSATITNSTDTAYLRTYDSANVSVSNSTIEFLDMYGSSIVSVSNSTIPDALQASDFPTVSVSNSSVAFLSIWSTSVNCSIFNINPGLLNLWDYQLNSSLVIAPLGYAPNMTFRNTEIDSLQFAFWSSNATITNSTPLRVFSYGHSSIWLVNTTTSNFQFNQDSRIYVSWFLDAHVIDSIGQNVPSTNVMSFYSNMTLADSKPTDTGGWARLTLMEKMMNATGAYPVGNYTVEAAYLTYSNSTTVNMTGNKQTILTLDGLVIPEFPSFLILASFMTAALLTVAVCKRKKWKLRLPFSLHKP
jgi:hypothetical protein